MKPHLQASSTVIVPHSQCPVPSPYPTLLAEYLPRSHVSSRLLLPSCIPRFVSQSHPQTARFISPPGLEPVRWEDDVIADKNLFSIGGYLQVFIGGYTTTAYLSTAGKLGIIAPSSSRTSLIDIAPIQYKADLLPYSSNPKHPPHPTYHRASSPSPIRRLLDAFSLPGLELVSLEIDVIADKSIVTDAVIPAIIALFSMLAYLGFRSRISLASLLLQVARNVSNHHVNVYFVVLQPLSSKRPWAIFIFTTIVTQGLPLRRTKALLVKYSYSVRSCFLVLVQ
ncbi:hypothetical protein BV22DRAFT_1135681 [Leucogyrophana mollusca]|uniref:Uncharacterized protein n=1 Tax=Leucogyrophana mollusca TaxID=85980 RepID=A0ACB8AVX2_9AGAM|nr:hypothetical protein BV22DRAFT_1135681 [Leucogyrophana mollusca]